MSQHLHQPQFVGLPQIEQGTINCSGCKCLVADNSDEGDAENSGDSEGDNSCDSDEGDRENSGDSNDHEGEGDNRGDNDESDRGNSGDGDDTARSEDSDDDTPQFPETVKVVGSPFENWYQEALAIVEDAYEKGEERSPLKFT